MEKDKYYYNKLQVLEITGYKTVLLKKGATSLKEN